VLDIHATCFTTSALLPGVGTYNTTIVMVFFCQLTLTDSCLRKPTTWLAGIAPPLGKVERARPSLTFATSRGGDAHRSPPELVFMTVHGPRNLDICMNTKQLACCVPAYRLCLCLKRSLPFSLAHGPFQQIDCDSLRKRTKRRRFMEAVCINNPAPVVSYANSTGAVLCSLGGTLDLGIRILVWPSS
jgi:hypothetical protein